jgi:ACS family glucarate transporter-like MFS transporter
MNRSGIPKRFVLVFTTFLLSVLLYVDRICIQVAHDPVLEELKFDDEKWAWILAAFALGYALFQVPGGWLADKLGPRAVLTTVISLWSLFTLLTGTAYRFGTMFVYRLLFGAGEAGAFPGMARAVYSWIPMKERGIVQGINFSGSRVGAALALPIMVALMNGFELGEYTFEGLGWRKSFFLLAGIGFVVAGLWYWWFRNDPSEHTGVSQEELEYIRANRQKAGTRDEDQPGLTLGMLFGSFNMWLAMIQYIASNFTFFFCLSWAYPYVKTRFDLPPGGAALVAAVPLLFGALGNWCSGIVVDWIYRRDRWVLSRRLPAIVGFALAACGILAFAFVKENPYLAVAFLSVAIFGADMTLSPSWSFCIDIGRKHAGAVSGTMNMAGNLSSFATPLAFFYLSETLGEAGRYFGVAAVLSVVAIVCWSFMRPDRKLEDW